MVPGQAAQCGEGTTKSQVPTTSRVWKKKVYFGLEDQCFFVFFFVIF